MAHKTSPARVEAFFRALGETGNQSIAAERARVSTVWARRQRRDDPAFAARLAATIAAATDRLRSAASVAPPARWREQAGEELTVRGGCGRQVQIARARLRQWTPRTEARFLAALASCCNVAAACRAVGLSQTAAYNHYRRWPDFEKRWDEALEEGYLRLELALLENAGRAFGAVDYPPDIAMPPMDYDQAMALLKLHQARVHGVGKRHPRRGKMPWNSEEVFESIGHKLDRLEAKVRADAAPDPAGARRDLDRGAKVVRGG